jgi:hypothetical protein
VAKVFFLTEPDTPVIVVKVIGAHDLPEVDILTHSSEPFVEFFLRPADKKAGPQNQRSSHKPRTLNPKWEPPERFQLICSDVAGSRIVVSV